MGETEMAATTALRLASLAWLLVSAAAGPTVYELDQKAGTAERIMVPVSSTVIPIDDLPEHSVGFGFGLADKERVERPAYPKDIKLITSANKHRFIVPGGVKQLTKEEFEAFTNQVLSCCASEDRKF